MENNQIHVFPKYISGMWKTNNLVKDLNSGSRIHFLVTKNRFNKTASIIVILSSTASQRNNNKGRAKTSLSKYIYLSLYCKVRKGCVGFHCERELETERKLQYFDPHSYGRQRCVFLVLLMLNQRPRDPLSARWWLSLLHLISIFSGPQLIRLPEGPFGRVWLSLPHLVHLLLQPSWLLSWLSYIIVQRPLDLWGRMFDHHQAEITVMQFTGHSLPVRQSMSVPWEFFYLVPFHQPISTHAISSHNCH